MRKALKIIMSLAIATAMRKASTKVIDTWLVVVVEHVGFVRLCIVLESGVGAEVSEGGALAVAGGGLAEKSAGELLWGAVSGSVLMLGQSPTGVRGSTSVGGGCF